MKTSDILKLSAKNIVSSKIKGLLCMISVCIGITSVSLIAEIGNEATSLICEQLDQLSPGAVILKSQSAPFENEDIEYISQNGGAEAAMPFIFEYSSYRIKNITQEALICGVDSSFDKVFAAEALHGDFFGDEGFVFEENTAFVDDVFAQKMYGRTNITGKEIKLLINGEYRTFVIKAVIKSQKSGIESLVGQTLPDIIYIPVSEINEIYGENKILSLAVNMKEGENDKKLTRTAGILSAETGSSYVVENISGYAEIIRKITAIITVFVSGIAAISVVVGGIGIMNSMVAGVENRKTEIGIYLALGGKQKDIKNIFICESAIIAVMGALAGIFISWVLLMCLNSLFSLSIGLSVRNTAICFGAAVLCGIVFGYLPASSASKLDPIDAIRWE